MSIDDDLRSYERALLRSGQDPKAVAMRLLGATEPNRFWIVVERGGRFTWPVPVMTASPKTEVPSARRVSFLVLGVWFDGYAMRVATLEEVNDLVFALTSNAIQFMAWDALTGRGVDWMSPRGMLHLNATNVRDGWSSGDPVPAPEPVPTGGGGDVAIEPVRETANGYERRP